MGAVGEGFSKEGQGVLLSCFSFGVLIEGQGGIEQTLGQLLKIISSHMLRELWPV